MKCCKCGTTDERFISLCAWGKDIEPVYLCIHCEVTDERHCDRGIQEQQEQGTGDPCQGEQEDCSHGTPRLLH